ncbi:hypothetical protein QUW44_07980 [Limosilactobacillus pontis]|uniref:Uncharacterized protein n=1 Tax=Limosilactobacillus pontis TaxID=35787 RepID=A0ABT7UZW7_9LACO|nr:hypothetical protein [Limosilactobacillus pontis]MDD7005867.1 hypothetical protein [Lactobacillus johnsonii]MDM8267082.1 hypothetical protein [Limosilactobacillus pontis]MDY6196124.1 hypothetical protein [Lactobacillus johnsonii]
MKNVYVVLDNDMENCIATTDVYNTEEKAKRGVELILAEVSDQYDEVEEQEDNSWVLINCDSIERVIEIQVEEVM